MHKIARLAAIARVRRLTIVFLSLACALMWGAVPATAGTGWSIQPIPKPTLSALVSVSCLSAASCTAVGYQPNPSRPAQSVPLAEHWNGTRWSIQPTPSPGAGESSLSAVSCSSATSCTAVGAAATNSSEDVPLAEHWNGTHWSIQPTPSPAPGIQASLEGVSCRSATACTAVGSYISDASTGDTSTLAETWNGTAWSIQTTPNPTGTAQGDLDGVSCPSATSCTAVGSYFLPLGHPQTLAERWNGTTWVIQPTPSPTGAKLSQLTAVSCSSATACTAAGWYGDASPTEFTLAERWNGTSWVIQPTPNPTGATDTILQAVSCPRTTACTAVGISNSSSSQPAVLAEYWNGTAWVIQNTPDPSVGNELAGVSCVAATTCTAVGHYNTRIFHAAGHLLAEHE